MFSRRCYARIVFTSLFLIYSAGAFSQPKSLERNLEPVVVAGEKLTDFTGANLGELFLFAFRDGLWQQIPFQFDERDTSGSYFIADQVTGLDANDELVFMARDAGDRADGSNWIDDGNSLNFIRYEIEVADTLAAGGQAWVYLYRSNSLILDPNLTDYVSYFSSTTGNAGQDTVRSLYYEIAHSTNGFPKDLKITNAGGGNNEDLLDVLKFRSRAFGSDITENNFNVNAQQGDDVFRKEGLIRVIRAVDVTITVFVFTFDYVTPPFFYYPYSTVVQLDVPDVGITVDSGRMSFDLNANATGMKFVSANNPEPGFTIDGVPDSPNKEIDSVLPNNNWMYISGSPQGTIVHLFPLSKSVGNARMLYYKDDKTPNTSDTGDSLSYGDIGNDISGGITPPATFKYIGYFLSSDQPSSVGAQIAAFERSPFDVNTTAQPFIFGAVALTSFSLSVEKNSVVLNWVTASEVNNAGFEIERRAHSVREWQSLAFVPGSGTSRTVSSYRFEDRGLAAGSYDYRLKMLDLDGSFEYSDIISAAVGLPETFALLQNFPNPFNPSTEIQYQIAAVAGQASGSARTVLKIYNLLGEEIRTLVDKEEAPGYYSVTWDGKDKSGRTASSGIYIYRLQSGHFVETRKMVFVQ